MANDNPADLEALGYEAVVMYGENIASGELQIIEVTDDGVVKTQSG